MLKPLNRLKPGTRFRCDDGRTGTLLMVNECRALVRLDGGTRDVEFVDGNGETRAFQGRYAKTTSWTPTAEVEPIGFVSLEKEEDDMSTATKSKKSRKSQSPKAPREPKAKAGERTDSGDVPQSPAERRRQDKVTLEYEKAMKLEAVRAKTAKSMANLLNKPFAKTKKAKAKAASTNGDAKTKKLSALDAAAKVLAEEGRSMSCKELIEAMGAKGLWTSPGGKTPSATLYAAMLMEIKKKGKDARFLKTDRGQFSINK